MNALNLKCPRCGGADLVPMDRAGIEIDVCPTCRGVWMDRGELDKMIERSTGLMAPAPERRDRDDDDDDDRRRPRGYDDDRRYDDRRYDDDRRYSGHPHKRGRNWLAELFD